MNATIKTTNISQDNKFGKFVVGPLEIGMGLVLGNALRRMMLSSIPGAAVSSVKIDGILHEFSSIPGVKEDVAEIIDNIKHLAIMSTAEGNAPKVAYIECSGDGVVTASDIRTDPDIHVMNPELVIAHLNGGVDCHLNIELTISKGRGYVSADRNKTEDMPIGVLPIDSIYSPIRMVNIQILDITAEDGSPAEELVIDITTNGTVNPKDSIALAAKVIFEHLSIFENPQVMQEEGTEEEKGMEEHLRSVLEMSVDEMELSVRSYNGLKRAGINSVADLANRSRKDLLKVRNLGEKSMKEILDRLDALGVILEDE